MGRIIGDIEGNKPGPLILIVAGLHGNEPAGVVAAEALFQWLNLNQASLSGRVVGLRGNLLALERGLRYIDIDMNRVWGVATLPEHHESREREELQREIELVKALPSQRVIVCDLHTTSGVAPPFRWVITDGDLNFPLSLPTVFGTTGAVKGTFGEWMARRGGTVVCVEGGEHFDPESAVNHRRILFSVLGLTGALPSETPEVIQAARELELVAESLPRECTIVAHHQISQEDNFQMRPGFRSFERVQAGDVIADDKSGEVAVPLSGHLLLPLYQKKGEDGFLIVREGRI